jgi:CheY-like chemotaxis protein
MRSAEEAGGARTVLVVDDNADAAETLEALLQMDGFEVRTVNDGSAAVASFDDAWPQFIIMDIGMPGMDGYEAARTIRQRGDGSEIVLIALTGWGQPTDKNRAMEAGFNYHFVKPVDYDVLLRCLQR